MENKTTSFKQLNQVYLALLMGQLFFAGVVIFLNWGELDTQFSSDNVFLYIAPVMLLSTIMFGNWMKNKAETEARKMQGSTAEKLAHYQRTMLICSAFSEGTNLFILVAFLLNSSIYLLLCFGLGLLVFLQYKPNLDAFTRRYNIPSSERNSL